MNMNGLSIKCSSKCMNLPQIEWILANLSDSSQNVFQAGSDLFHSKFMRGETHNYGALAYQNFLEILLFEFASSLRISRIFPYFPHARSDSILCFVFPLKSQFSQNSSFRRKSRVYSACGFSLSALEFNCLWIHELLITSNCPLFN